MLNITAEEKKTLKGRGYIMSKDGEHFVARIITVDGTLTDAELLKIAEASRKFGSGKVALTSRMTVEVQGLTYENLEPFNEFIAEAGLYTGGTGARVRPIVPCKGTVCVHGLIDTQGLARELHETFYKGWYDIALPHKFKIGIGGCPNNCVKPGLNDFGIMGWKGGYRIFVGGIWGKKQRPGTLIDRVFTKDEVFEMLERCLLLFMELADGKERFGAMIDRIGVENFLAQLEAGDVMDRKSQILAR
ncbi:MAG: (4Fe-4S)-binding protein [Clostridiales bacterium]|nr:(4Fe-4S)-binding protein [Clostridiales bacterium]